MTTLIRINNKSELEQNQEYLFSTAPQSILEQYGGNIDNVPDELKCKFKARYLYTDNTIISQGETDRDLFIFKVTKTNPTLCSNPEFINPIKKDYQLMYGNTLFTSNRIRIYRSPSRDIYRSEKQILSELHPKMNEDIAREIKTYLPQRGGKYRKSRKSRKSKRKKTRRYYRK